MIELNNLETNPGSRRWRKRVGRGPGSGNGKTSARGHKGQRARSGYSRRASFEGGQMPINRRAPKRGFWHGDRHPVAIVNLYQLEKAFDAGAEVSIATVVKAGLARLEDGGLKVLAQGDITKKLIVKAAAVSAQARAKIEAAGGTIELTGPAVKAGEEK